MSKKEKNKKKKSKGAVSYLNNLLEDVMPKESVNEVIETLGFDPEVSHENMLQFISDPKVRTVTVVAEVIHCLDESKFKFVYHMESGRMAAQVGHAVSKLKMCYLEDLIRKNPARTNLYVGNLSYASITSIVLKARNEDELFHIGRLCIDRGIRHVYFEDENEEVYGKGRYTTALSIGPVSYVDLEGITDYLPLWKDE